MAALEELKAVVAAAARKGLAPTDVIDVDVEPTVASDGDAMFRVTITVPDDQFDKIDGSHYLSTLLNVKEGVRGLGDDRLTVVDYRTPSEMADDGDPES